MTGSREPSITGGGRVTRKPRKPAKPTKPGDPGDPSDPRKVQLLGQHVNITVRLGSGTPQITDTSGGWQIVSRPMDIGLTDWQGAEPLRVVLPILLDGYLRNETVEDRERELRELTRPFKDERPPTFRMWGAAVPLRGRTVVADTLAVDDTFAPIRSPRGKLLRQGYTLTVIQYVDPDTLRIRKKKGDGKKSGKRERSKRGDTPRKVAARQGDPSKAREIAKANGLRDTRKEIPEGTLLRIP